MKLKQSHGFGAIEVIIIAAVLLVIGGLAWYGLKGAQTKQTTASPTPQESSNTTTKQSSFTNGKTTVTITHPSSWQTESTSLDEDGFVSKKMWIKSDQGLYLHLQNNSGVGGNCNPNTYSYTLTKKFATASKDIFFTQYTQTDPKNPTGFLVIEDFANRNQLNTTQKEGDTATDSCNMPVFSTVGTRTTEDEIFVTLTKDSMSSISSKLTYSDVSGDTEFLKMLQSLTVKQ